MTINKFGVNISKRNVTENGEMSNFRILPIIAEDKQKVCKLTNGSNILYYKIDEDDSRIAFPLSEGEISFVHSHPEVPFLINGKVFTVKDLIGQELLYGDDIGILRSSEKHYKVPVLYVGLVIKYQIRGNKDGLFKRRCR